MTLLGGPPALRLDARAPSLTERALARRSLLRRVDWWLSAAALILALLGAVLVWSATQHDAGASYLYKDILNIAIGLVLGVGATVVNHRLLRAYTPLVYVAACAGLVLVLLIGSTINGAHSWIVLGGGFQLQPSELAKVALVAGMAFILGERQSTVGSDPHDVPQGRDVGIVLMLAAVPMGLIMLQPDLGTLLVFAFVILGVLAISGVSWKWVAGLLLAGVLVAVLAVSLHVLQPYQLARFTAFAHPGADAQGLGYNTQQARTAIGSGGFSGSGLFHGSQTNGGFVPEQQTDFVFTVAGEELGFLGSSLIVLLFGVILWRGFQIAANAKDLYGRLLATGVVSWFAFQTFVNIGMTLGLMPVTGLPLPFVSYGGSAMFANFLAIGLLLNVHLSTDRS